MKKNTTDKQITFAAISKQYKWTSIEKVWNLANAYYEGFDCYYIVNGKKVPTSEFSTTPAEKERAKAYYEAICGMADMGFLDIHDFFSSVVAKFDTKNATTTQKNIIRWHKEAVASFMKVIA